MSDVEQVPEVMAARISGRERAAALFAAAALLLLGGISTLIARRLDSREAVVSEQRKVLALLGSRSLSVLEMTAAPRAPRAAGRIFVPKEGGSMAVLMTGLDDPGAGTYTLWVIVDGKPVSLKDFRPGPGGVAVVHLPIAVDIVEGMFVTLEPSEGGARPRGPDVLRSA